MNRERNNDVTSPVWLTYLDAASHQVSDGLLTAALEPMKDEVSILFHLHGRQELIVINRLNNVVLFLQI